MVIGGAVAGVSVLVAAVALINFMSVSLANVAEPQEEGTIESAQADSWYDSEGRVYYPINPGDEGWADMTSAEQHSAVAVPEKILQQLSTEDVIILALEYPYAWDVFAFDNMENGFGNLVQSSTVYSELSKREDLVEVLSGISYDVLSTTVPAGVAGDVDEGVLSIQERFLEGFMEYFAGE